jgi:hypothetical protein
MENKAYAIGVTGHRILPPEKIVGLTEGIKKFYGEKSARYGAGNITVLSSAAEGADTLCAELALIFDFKLLVPLPMPAKEYRKDFSAKGAAAFDALLSSAGETFVVEPVESIPKKLRRGFFYRQAGIYVAMHCDILLAVWDGVEKNTSDGAGTWETVKTAMENKIKVHQIKP